MDFLSGRNPDKNTGVYIIKVFLSHLIFTLKKNKAQSRRSPRRQGLSSAMIPIPMSELK